MTEQNLVHKPAKFAGPIAMRWFDEWRALSDRIEGLLRAATFVTGTLETFGRGDQAGVVGKSLLPELEALTISLRGFGEEHSGDLPAEARAALDEYLRADWSAGANTGPLQALAPLVVCRSRFDYAVRSSESQAVRLVELAFEHLSRSILVDEQIRERWQEAFSRGERACEKLGAVHLLGHGVWAFKVSSDHAVTDLVLAEPLERFKAQIDRAARTVALTEWKLVRDGTDVERIAAEARKHAAAYSPGVLGGLELKGTRYVVLVAEGQVRHPEDHPDGAILYRHICLAVDPWTPTQAARQQKVG